MSESLKSANRATRQAMLDRIRAGVGRASRSAAVEFSEARGPQLSGVAGESAGSPALKARFIRYALASSSSVVEVDVRSDVPAAVSRYLRELGLPLQAAVWRELADLDWVGAGVTVDARAANGDDAVGITGVYCALAETGSLLNLSGPETAATTSLLPETHVAIVPVSRIVASMEDAFALIRAERGCLPRALNFISGPSRTGDIEQTIVLGAHGPSRVHLVLINDTRDQAHLQK